MRLFAGADAGAFCWNREDTIDIDYGTSVSKLEYVGGKLELDVQDTHYSPPLEA